MPEFTDSVQFKPHPNELDSAVYGQHAVRFRYDDREYPVNFSIHGDPDQSEWHAKTDDGDLNWVEIELSAEQANAALDTDDAITVETDGLLLVISGEYDTVKTDEECPANGCVFFLEEHHDGTLACPTHGQQMLPEYETTNDVPQTEATGLGDFA